MHPRDASHAGVSAGGACRSVHSAELGAGENAVPWHAPYITLQMLGGMGRGALRERLQANAYSLEMQAMQTQKPHARAQARELARSSWLHANRYYMTEKQRPPCRVPTHYHKQMPVSTHTPCTTRPALLRLQALRAHRSLLAPSVQTPSVHLPIPTVSATGMTAHVLQRCPWSPCGKTSAVWCHSNPLLSPYYHAGLRAQPQAAAPMLHTCGITMLSLHNPHGFNKCHILSHPVCR